jgi:hypothetical protein
MKFDPMPLPNDIKEKDFQNMVVKYAQHCGWLIHHTRPAMRQSGKWSTPIQGNAGFPDLVLARNGELLIVELKSAKGRLSDKQNDWMEALAGNGARLWRPADWPHILKVLR